MKKTLLAATWLFLTVLSVPADLIWYEPFNYPDGCIETNAGGVWICHSPSPAKLDAIVGNHQLQNSATGGALSRQDDVNRPLATTAGSPYTNAPQYLYASFTINCTNLPNGNGTYFAHFLVNNSTFQGKVFALTGNAASNAPLNFVPLPNTYRLGVSGVANYANKVFPVDLAMNTAYQVVIGWDPAVNYSATLWVNPTDANDASVASNDPVSAPKAATAFAFRQASSFGNAFFTITNLAVATTFDEAATNVWNTAPAAPVVVYQPKSVTNFVGNPATLSVVAAGQGLAGLTYQWQKNGGDVPNPNGNTNVFTIASLATSDAGSYTVVVGNPTTGLSTTSAVANVAVNTQPVPPQITEQPTNTTVYFGQTATLSVTATGEPPLTYQWLNNGNPISGATDATLNVPNVQTNNGTTGTYRCDVTNPFGTTPSSNAVLAAVAPPVVTIGHLRGLVDPVFFLPTNTTALYTVTGIVTSWTNLTTPGNSSFYLQDDTGGIDVFFAGADAQPQAGDRVTVTGPLGQFNSLLELNLDANDPSNQVLTNSQNNLLPPGAVLPFSFTNSAAFGGVGDAIRWYQGSVVMFTNVFFPDGFAGTNVFAGGQNYTLTNQAGETFALRVDSRVGDIIGQPIPPFAWTVSGPMSFFLGNTATNRSGGYQLLPTRYADIVTSAPPPATGAIALVNGQTVVSWTAQPFMSYSLLCATDAAGPFVPLITGLTFNTPAGQYTDTNPVPATRFYRIVSP